MNRSQFNKAIVPGLFSLMVDAYRPRAGQEEWRQIVSAVKTSTRAYEESAYYAGLGNLSRKPEGEPIQYDELVQGPTKRWTHTVYALGARMTEELIEDSLYPEIGEMETISRELGTSAKETLNVLSFDMYNNGTATTSHTGGDGLALFTTAHTALRGGTWSNLLSPGADLSAVTLQTMIQNFETTKDDTGKYQLIRPKQILVNPANEWKVKELLQSTYDPESPNNAVNVLRSRNLQPIVTPYYTDTDAATLIAEPPSANGGFIAFMRRKVTFARDGDFQTGDALFKVTFRFSVECNKANHVYHSAGA